MEEDREGRFRLKDTPLPSPRGTGEAGGGGHSTSRVTPGPPLLPLPPVGVGLCEGQRGEEMAVCGSAVKSWVGSTLSPRVPLSEGRQSPQCADTRGVLWRTGAPSQRPVPTHRPWKQTPCLGGTFGGCPSAALRGHAPPPHCVTTPLHVPDPQTHGTTDNPHGLVRHTATGNPHMGREENPGDVIAASRGGEGQAWGAMAGSCLGTGHVVSF